MPWGTKLTRTEVARRNGTIRSSQNVNELEKNAAVWRVRMTGKDLTDGGEAVVMTNARHEHSEAKKRIQSDTLIPGTSAAVQ